MEGSIVAVIGGFLTAGAGLVIDSTRERVRIGQIRSLLKKGVCSDLANAVHLYDKLIQDWQKTGRLWPKTLHELEKSSPTYHSNPEWLGLFDEYACSKELYDYHAESTQLFAQITRQYCELSAIEDAHMPYDKRYEEAKEALNASMTQLIQCRNQAIELLNILYFDKTAKVA